MFKHHNRVGKLVLSGSLVLALSVPLAGAASAAGTTATTTGQSQTIVYSLNSSSLAQLAQQYGFDLNSLLGQLQKGAASGGWTVGTGTTGGGSGWTGGYGDGGSGSTAGSGSTVGSGSTGGGSGASGSTGSGSTSGSGSTAGSGSSAGSTSSKSDYAAQVVDLVNQERAKAGLKALKTDTKLTGVALAKAKDMYANNYFDHTSPTYGSPFDMMKQFGVTYSYAGENIAKGQQNPSAVMTAWMNSQGHRENILNTHYTSIGVAYYNGEWVQEFTG